VRPRHHNLIEEIERDALNRETSIADTLRKLVALGGQAGSTALRDWASHELRGYLGTDVDELPAYRRPGAAIFVNVTRINARITGQQISPRQLPEGVREHVDEVIPLTASIGEIEAMLERARANGGHIHMTLPGAQDILTLMNHQIGDPSQQITEIYWSVSEPALAGVIDQVRTTLVELVAEMRAGMPETAETPSAAVADQAVNVAVHGRRARVHVTSAQASGSGSHEVHVGGSEHGGFSWRRLGAAIVGPATVAGVVIAVLQWQGWGF
jgi:hypothetical protein